MNKPNRILKWKSNKKLSPLFFESPTNKDFDILLEESGYNNELKNKITSLDIAELAHEYIFNTKKGLPIIHVICPVLDTFNFKLKYCHSLDILFDGSPQEIERNVINTLALAVACEVPIYPNNKKVENELIYYYKKLIQNGFTAPNEHGEDVKLIPTNSKSHSEYNIEHISMIDFSNSWSASDLLLLRENITTELQKLSNAQKTLARLQIAIEQLEKLLNSSHRNENSLQKCISENPILFGLEYANMIPKYKLGAEFEVDYALQKFSGLIDLVEIESSNLPLFTKSGNPSSYLVHAEQQIIDWIDWVEKNNPYARAKMPGLLTPKGIIIIGRNQNLTEKTTSSLIRRNKAFNGLINILTYDDLLNKAKTILDILSSK